jgi:hypothetical protein
MTTIIDRPTSTTVTPSTVHMHTLPGTIHVEVTDVDIAAGSPGDSGACPIALALRRTYPSLMSVEVDTYVQLETDINYWQYELPTDAVQFILAFDACQFVEPFAFDMSWAEGQ